MSFLYKKKSKSNPGDNEEEERLLLVSEDDENALEDYEVRLQSLPFEKIIDQCRPFNDPALMKLVPGCELRVLVHDVYSRDKKCWFTFEVEHGCFNWTLRRRLRDFKWLHDQLTLFRTLETIKIPDIKIEKNLRTERSSLVVKTVKFPSLPTFPSETVEIVKQVEARRKSEELQEYISSLLKISKFISYRVTLEFLEIGSLSFVEELGTKCKEGYVRRMCHSRSHCVTHVVQSCVKICPCWKKRWLFIKENFVGLINPNSGKIEDVLLLDRVFCVNSDNEGIGQALKPGAEVGILIQNLHKKLYVKCENEYEVESWIIEFNMMMNRGSASDFVSANRFISYAPVRPMTECRWIVDGATYFEAVAKVLMNAKEEIFIADWWLSPEIYMKRPTVQGHYWQLDHVLRAKAREGVRIYILLYKELSMALGINSLHSSAKLSTMHRNIKVIRHPEVSTGVWLWAHHEKIVCVDQTYAFMGGIDLCYGRWDDYQHRLCDIGDVIDKTRVLRHFSTVAPDLPVIPEIKKSISDPSLPKSKEMIEALSEKQALRAAHFKIAAEKLIAARKFDRIKRRLLMEAKEDFAPIQKASVDRLPQLTDRRRTLQETAIIALGIEKKYRLWHGKDYANFISKDFENLHEPYSDMIDRSLTPRMPWHDVGLFVQGRCARDIARHFILRWNHAKKAVHYKDNSFNYLLPKSYDNFGDNVPSVLHDTIGTIFRAECQVLRSLSKWSGNIQQTESSIHEAYVETIQKAKHFIYIENQFFITQPTSSRSVFNKIADALFNRIIKAYRKQETFHVYVVLPLLPAFQGTLGSGTGTCIQAITHWNNASIGGGHSSLIHRLARHVKDPSIYINFYGLRTYGFLNTKLVTELVYVHSKLLIADDEVAIIGSANINDRSLLGSRDSEIAVYVTDKQFLENDGKRTHPAGKFCYSLRTSLFREHLGMLQDPSLSFDLNNPSGEEFYRDVWYKTAEKNTSIYEKVFRCIPSDNVKTFEQLREYQSTVPLVETDPNRAMSELKFIQGYLVQFPTQFLGDERLEPTASTKEHYLPTSLWT